MTDSSKYKNPSNTEEILESLKTAETHSDVVKIINNTFPDWIIGWPKKYSKDYPSLTKNWEEVCNKFNSQMLCIVIVDFIDFTPEYSLIKAFCELLTLFGHSVRRKEEFFECKFCGDILPTESLYNSLKKSGDKHIPAIWSMKCTNC